MRYKATLRCSRLRQHIIKSVPCIQVERAKIVTEAYAQFDKEAIVTKRARAFEKVMNELPIHIQTDELLVGSACPAPRGAQIFPEFSWKWIEDELDTFDTREYDPFFVSEASKCALRNEIIPYWQGKTVQDRIFSLLPDEVKSAAEGGLFSLNGGVWEGIGHIIPDFDRLLEVGLYGLIREAEEGLKILDTTNPDGFKKALFCRAAIISCRAAIRYARRHAEKAMSLAKQEKDSKRKSELEKIARICRYVPGNPPRTFHEALQFVWFMMLLPQIESNGHSISFGRFDQYMYPFYRRDMDKGKISRHSAKELLECLWIKANELRKVKSTAWTKAFPGYTLFMNLVIGGLTPDGKDATNDLSYLVLDVDASVRLPMPSLSVRIHRKTPQRLLHEVAKVIKLGFGKPAVFNDEIIIQGKINRLPSECIPDDIPKPKEALRLARNYAIVGCVEPGVPGRELVSLVATRLNLAKCLELALNNGICPCSHKRLGPESGDILALEEAGLRFEDIMQAVKAQIADAVRRMVTNDITTDFVHRELTPYPFSSSIVSECIKRGKDMMEGGIEFNTIGQVCVGIATVADSLAAIKKLVFEEKKISIAGLKKALDRNFEGNENLRMLLMNKAPKFGNDDDYVDSIAREITSIFSEEVEKNHFARGIFVPGLFSNVGNVPHGELCGATPDGRLARQPLSDNVSPAQGRDKLGPTAVLKSVSKIDCVKANYGNIVNIKLHPSALEGKAELRKFEDFLRASNELNIFETQYNVISADTLRDAQKHPEKYSDLVVRVAGFCALFIDLGKSVQNDIIMRTEHGRL